MRPQQWTKNAIVLAGVMFGGQASDPGTLARAIGATVAFCAASSAIYVFNDWHDRAEDRLHPTKRLRPIAAGLVSPAAAATLGSLLVLVSMAISLAISPGLAGIVALYLALMAAYALWLRRVAILDVFIIASGFLLRAWVGAVAVEVPLSAWLFLCTLLLALMLGFGKRRHELVMLQADVNRRRPSLRGYARLRLDAVLIGIALVTMGSYALYAVSIPSFGRSLPMFVTVPFVVVAIGRYVYLVLGKNLGGSPEILLVRDRMLFGCIVLWAATVGLVLAS